MSLRVEWLVWAYPKVFLLRRRDKIAGIVIGRLQVSWRELDPMKPYKKYEEEDED